MTPGDASATARVGRPGRRAFTLIEVVLASAIASILLMALTSCLLLSLRALPRAGDGPTSTLLASAALDQLTGELETALLITEQTATAITFTVPPRGADTAPERIRYSWTGVAGDPLLRQYDGGPAVAVVDQVYQFSLSPSLTTATEGYPGVAIEDASPSLLFDDSTLVTFTNQSTDVNNWSGQYFGQTSWPANTVGWRPTSVSFQAIKKGGAASSTTVQFSLAGATQLPCTALPEQYVLSSSSLTLIATWQSFAFTTLPRLAPTAGACLTLQPTAGAVSAVTNNAGVGLLAGTGPQHAWAYSGTVSLQAKLYGKLSRSGATQYATSRYAAAISASLRAGSRDNPAVLATAQCLNHPELVSLLLELKFASNPTTVSLNGLGTPDWALAGGGAFNASTLVGGAWVPAAGTSLLSLPADNYARLTMVDVRFNALASGGSATVSFNAARSGANCAPVMAQVAMAADGTQTLTAYRKLSDATLDTLLVLPQLPAGPVDLHMVVDPTAGSVSLRVNQLQCGSFPYCVFTSADPSRGITLTTAGSAQFGYFRLREVLP